MFDSSVVDCRCHAYDMVVVVFIVKADGGGGWAGVRLECKIVAFKELDQLDVSTD